MPFGLEPGTVNGVDISDMDWVIDSESGCDVMGGISSPFSVNTAGTL
jgi:hypothetical protein